jgi:arginine/lysine/ornithine decarboxylase
VEKYLDEAEQPPVAVYITSPDYLGNMSDIKEIARVCHERGVLLAVDNAHGAYLNFLEASQHPIALGADICCDSAHKTLPVLTGGAYLHVSKNAPKAFAERAKDAMALFGSTSPSYLILASLDAANKYISNGYCERLALLVAMLDEIKARLVRQGYELCGDEPMKLTVAPKSYGYTGYEIAQYLDGKGIVAEFADPDFIVLMPSVETNDDELARLCDALLTLPRRQAIEEKAPRFELPIRATSIRDAIMSDCENLPVCECKGRILGAVTVGCPPAVPIAVSGEIVDENIIKCFEYYGIEKCLVIKE